MGNAQSEFCLLFNNIETTCRHGAAPDMYTEINYMRTKNNETV